MSEKLFIYANTGVFWDVLDCPVPKGLNPDVIYANIISGLGFMGYHGRVSTTWAYSKKVSEDVFWEYEENGIRIQGVKGDQCARVDMMTKDILLFALSNPKTPANVVLIANNMSQKPELIRVLQVLQSRNFNVVVAQPDTLVPVELHGIVSSVCLSKSLLARGKATILELDPEFKSVTNLNFLHQVSEKISWKSTGNTGVFWDTKDCPDPNALELDFYLIEEKIKSSLATIDRSGSRVSSISAYEDGGKITVWNGGTNTKMVLHQGDRSKRMLLDILLWAIDNRVGQYHNPDRTPNVMVITRNIPKARDYLNTLNYLSSRECNIIFGVPDELKSLSSWTSVTLREPFFFSSGSSQRRGEYQERQKAVSDCVLKGKPRRRAEAKDARRFDKGGRSIKPSRLVQRERDDFKEKSYAGSRGVAKTLLSDPDTVAGSIPCLQYDPDPDPRGSCSIVDQRFLKSEFVERESKGIVEGWLNELPPGSEFEEREVKGILERDEALHVDALILGSEFEEREVKGILERDEALRADALLEELGAYGNIGVYWDMVDCPIPKGLKPDLIYKNIISALGMLGYHGKVRHRMAYAREVSKDVFNAGICMQAGPDEYARVYKMTRAILLFALDNPYKPSNLMVIADNMSQKLELIRVLQILNYRNFNVVVAQPDTLIPVELDGVATSVCLPKSLLLELGITSLLNFQYVNNSAVSKLVHGNTGVFWDTKDCPNPNTLELDFCSIVSSIKSGLATMDKSDSCVTSVSAYDDGGNIRVWNRGTDSKMVLHQGDRLKRMSLDILLWALENRVEQYPIGDQQPNVIVVSKNLSKGFVRTMKYLSGRHCNIIYGVPDEVEVVSLL